MADIKLNSEHKIDFSTGDMQVITGNDAIAQHLGIRLRFFKGEWFISIEEGIPYLQTILQKNVPVYVLNSIFRQALSKTPGIQKVVDLDIDFVAAERKLTIEFRVQTTDNQILDYSDEFIITGF